ncbi:CPBP family intramembrane glutamic endopeptidase [Bacteriovorax sp. Seq25_V]|uniref:CPBP family intramembrane glutamic endopeptidase n=1 Tax=Bacteriovorax sp. Seq25_V TaxID=1201288 RepID=UPI000389F0A6|nr:CPBP family intramembrane glutamic endopeptidase [Bacteriovorax sp. Seq25_V]EQC47509.1 CAAX protease self-immunity [Bacteriovorax sp. Seq25_V]
MKTFILLCLFILNTSVRAQAYQGLSSIIPGLGQSMNGSHWEGASYFVSSVGLLSMKDPKLRTLGLNIAFYSMYDAWRDAGGTPSNRESFIFYDYAQMFNPLNASDSIAVGFLSLAAYNRSTARDHAIEDAEREDDQEKLYRLLRTDAWKSIFTFAAVGMGEEALFRGFLFPSMSSTVGIWGGAIFSSALFAFAHVGATTEENIGRTIMGLAFCWQYHRNNYNLNSNIFTHAWYDQILVGPFNIADKSNSKKIGFNNMPIGLTLTFKMP